MLRVIFMFLVVTSSLVAEQKADNFTDILPYVNKCSRQQKLLEMCIRHSILSMRLHLIFGVPRLNISSFMPYYIERCQLNTRSPLIGTITFTNMRLYGLTRYMVNTVRISDDLEQIKILAELPHVQMVANCDVNGTISSLSIKLATHVIKWNITSITADITINTYYYKSSHDREKYFEVFNVLVILEIERMHTYTKSNIKTSHLTNIVNEYLDRNWDIILPQILPNIQRAASDVIHTTTNKIFSRFPINMLLLP